MTNKNNVIDAATVRDKILNAKGNFSFNKILIPKGLNI